MPYPPTPRSRRGRAISPKRLRLVRATAVVSTLLALVPSARAGADPLPQSLELVIRGGGWGHGHGMSQYGARAQAEEGRTWRQILEHYYTGIAFGDTGAERIRVLLSSGSGMVAGGPERIVARWGDGSEILRSTAEEPYVRVRATSSGVAIDRGESGTGSWRQVTSGTGRVRFEPVDGPAVPVYPGGRIKYYRGLVEAYRRSATSIYAINDLPLDHYLYGVVPREMPSSWHGQALRAQAVAARSYTMWKKENAGSASPYHICVTTMCQVYGGYGERSSHGGSMTVLERDATNAAVDDTSGVLMTDDGAAIFAEYHSSSGGHTAQGSRPYLAPVSDPWDERYSPHHRWTARISVAEIEDRWRSIGRLTAVTVTNRDGKGPWGGRVDEMTVVGTDATVTVSGDTFRSSFWWPNNPDGIRSRLFTLSMYDAEIPEPPAEIVLSPGDAADVVLRFRNTGTIDWPVGETVRLATADPAGRSSAFATAQWLSGSRVGFIAANVTTAGAGAVAQGETAEFRFSMRAPADATSGLYPESFELMAGDARFGPAATIGVRVRLPGASHLGANLVSNPSFDAAYGTGPAAWTPIVVAESDLRDTTRRLDGRASLRIAGDPAARKAFAQTIPEPGSAGERFVLSAWNRADGTTKEGNRIDATALFRHVDGTTTALTVPFPQKPHGWTSREAALTAPRDFQAIELSVNARNQTGTTWFDRVHLARNALANGGFEEGAESWTFEHEGARTGIEREQAQSGGGSLRIGARDANVYARQAIDVIGIAGHTYRLSGWNRSVATRASGGAVRLWARVRHLDGSVERHRLDFPRAAHTWRYAETLFTADEPYTGIDVFAKVDEQTGTAWFDDVSIARASRRHSLAANPDFEVGSPKPGDWSLFNAPTAEGISTAASVDGDASLYLEGTSTKTVYARQRVPVGGIAGDVYKLSGWNRTSGSSGSGGPVRVWARVVHTDGTIGAFRIEFPRAPHGWTEGALRFTAVKEYRRIDVFTKFERQTGRAWFDTVRLERVAER